MYQPSRLLHEELGLLGTTGNQRLWHFRNFLGKYMYIFNILYEYFNLEARLQHH